MVIKDGYNGKETTIRIHKASDVHERKAELWIAQTAPIGEHNEEVETLSYITLDELLNLKDEINDAIKEIVG